MGTNVLFKWRMSGLENRTGTCDELDSALMLVILVSRICEVLTAITLPVLLILMLMLRRCSKLDIIRML